MDLSLPHPDGPCRSYFRHASLWIYVTEIASGDIHLVSVSAMRFLTLQSSDGTCWRRTTGWTKLGSLFSIKQLRELNYPASRNLARPLRVSKRQGHIVVHIWDFQTHRSSIQKASCCCQGVVKRSQCPRSREWGRDGAGASCTSVILLDMISRKVEAWVALKHW